MRADYIAKQELGHILAALTPQNRLVLEISMATGLRLSDVLSLRSGAVFGAKDGRLTVREQKTGKNRRIRLPSELRQRALEIAGRLYVFEGRLDSEKPRTRQAVYKDLARASALFRLPKLLHVSPHTARKIYAVEQYRKSSDLKKVQKLLQHESEAVTAIYAMADALTARKLGKPGI